MGSSRRYNIPPPTPAHGWGTYNGKDLANPNAAYPTTLMPDNEPPSGSAYGGSGLNRGYSVDAMKGLQGISNVATGYSPFFMRF